jgi:hypothetical protein
MREEESQETIRLHTGEMAEIATLRSRRQQKWRHCEAEWPRQSPYIRNDEW